MPLRESVKPPVIAQPPSPPLPPPRCLRRAAWLKLLLAPLLGLSLAAHALLLLAPVPTRSPADDAAAEEEFVDLLSISSLPASEPPLEPESEQPPAAPSEVILPPPAQAVAPTVPTQPMVPEAFPDTPPPEAAPEGALPPAEPTFDPSPPPPVIVEAEVTEIFTSLTRGAGDSDFDSTATSFPAIAYLTRGGINTWSAAEQSCFFEQISDADYRLRPNAVSLRYLTRNEQHIRNEDVPRTFQAAQYQVSDVPGGFCDRTLFQVLRNGQPFLFVSVVGIGVGAPGQQATGLVIIWSSDPRTG
ncbi:hypothetical protein [Nodosilinea sp. E11]|uniref:hypothetical protein n=1 Tax=Nodosilinea sp. E11 TaxID=3037479 RepID=UPI0029353180|nr:hypothetical protein [Nodosilinea sp. E11]WOD39091.1 hypothetical protein RRF56_23060 [Nodosilinea sp. E11]